MSWLLDDVDARLVNGLRNRIDLLVAETDAIAFDDLPDEVENPLRDLATEISRLGKKLGEIAKTT